MFGLAPKYHGYSISAQSFEFYPHLTELNNLDFTLYYMDTGKNKFYKLQIHMWCIMVGTIVQP